MLSRFCEEARIHEDFAMLRDLWALLDVLLLLEPFKPLLDVLLDVLDVLDVLLDVLGDLLLGLLGLLGLDLLRAQWAL